MRNSFRYFLPFGIVRSSQMFDELRTLGIGRLAALAAACHPATNRRLQRSRLQLLPAGALARLHCVIDAGANVGDWTHDLLRFCVPEHALVIEPDPRLTTGLRERFSNVPQVKIHNVALGAQEGSLPFYQMAQSDMNSLFKPTTDARQTYGDIATIENTIQVPVKTLDTLAANLVKVNLLKLDVQGFEQHVLRGGTDTLRRTDAIILELNFVSHYQGDLCFHELDSMMNDLGFALSNYSPPARDRAFREVGGRPLPASEIARSGDQSGRRDYCAASLITLHFFQPIFCFYYVKLAGGCSDGRHWIVAFAKG